jgi:hypothetical protein
VFALVPDITDNGTVISRYYDMSTGGNGNSWPTANLSIGADGLNVTVAVSGINHVLGLNHFLPGTNANPSKIDPNIDWTELLITVAIRHPDPVAIQEVIGNTTNGQAIVIYVDGAELWWVAPATVLGVSGHGRLYREENPTGSFTRDDRPWLRAVMALAMGWYSKRRTACTVSIAGIGRVPAVQSMVQNIENAIGVPLVANSLVSEVIYDFASMQTTMVTDFANLDAPAFAGMLRPTGNSIGGVQSPQMREVKDQINKVRRQEGTPVRISNPGGGGGSGTGTTTTVQGASIANRFFSS